MSTKTNPQQSGSTHEQMEAHAEVRLGSERSFGLVFTAVFAIVGLMPLLSSQPPRYAWLGVAAAFLAIALTFPSMLAPLNRLWFRFGLLLHRVVNPLIMGLLFFVVITPIGLLMRLAGKDVLRLRPDSRLQSYWTKREPPGPARDSFKNQF